MDEKREKNLIPYVKMIYQTVPSLKWMAILGIIRDVFWSFFTVGLISLLLTSYEAGKSFSYMIGICLIAAFASLLMTSLGFLWWLAMERLRRTFYFRIKNRIYRKLYEIDYATYQSSAFLNNYMKLLNEGIHNAWQTQYDINELISGIIRIVLLSAVIAMMNIYVIIYAILIGVVYFIFSRYIARLYRLVSEANKQNYRERIYIRRMYYLKDAAFDVRSTPISELLLDINDEVGKRIVKNVDKYNFKIFAATSTSESLVRFIYPLGIAFIAMMVIINDYTSAFYMPIILAAGQLLWSVRDLASSVGRFQEIALSSKDYFRIIDTVSPLETEGGTEIDNLNLIELKNVTFNYQEHEKAAIENVNITIKKGEKIAIVGENGAGKTTFVKLLLRLYDPTTGNIYYNSTNYREFCPKVIREKVGAVFQNYQVYALSVAENVLLRKVENEDDEQLVIEALKFAELYDKISKTADGINTQITKEFDKNGLELSGGERQKLALARVYASHTELLLLDEPSSALDPIAEAKIYEKMMSLANIKTLIFISHRLSTTSLADRIYFFDKGKIIESGSHEQLMKIENGRYKMMFETQAKEYLEKGGE